MRFFFRLCVSSDASVLQADGRHVPGILELDMDSEGATN